MSEPTTPESSPAGRDEEAQFTQSMNLFERYQSTQDEDSLNELFARYRERLTRRVSIMMSERVQAHTGASDVAQSALIVALDRMDEFTFHEPASLLAFLSSIARHRILNLSRKKAAKLEVPFSLDLHDYDGGKRAPASPSQAMETEERNFLVDQAVTQLPEHYCTIIVLRDLDMGSWPYIASVTGLTVGAAQARHRRARRELKKVMGETQDSEE